jgi:hypothetical protein
MTNLNKTLRFALSAVCALSLVSTVAAQARPAPAQARTGAAETRLIGIALFDSGLKLISRFGSPDDIQPIGVGLGAGGAGGAGGGLAPGAPAGGPGIRPGGRPGGGGGGREEMGGEAMAIGPEPPLGLMGDPFGFGAAQARQTVAAPAAAQPGGGAAPGGARAGGFGAPGDPSLAGPGMGGPGAPGVPGAPAAEAADVQLTRWIYRRGGSRYSFVLNRWNQVVQIEAVGLRDPRVRTRRGITFGSTFGQVLNAHRTPDGYDIAGDSMLVRFILRDRVAFRLSRTEPNRPHRVTGIVVTAGKP